MIVFGDMCSSHVYHGDLFTEMLEDIYWRQISRYLCRQLTAIVSHRWRYYSSFLTVLFYYTYLVKKCMLIPSHSTKYIIVENQVYFYLILDISKQSGRQDVYSLHLPMSRKVIYSLLFYLEKASALAGLLNSGVLCVYSHFIIQLCKWYNSTPNYICTGLRLDYNTVL